MSNLGNSLRMLFMLRRGTVIKAKDIAEKLEVSKKQVVRYKETLDEFFNIESIPGPNGGYKLVDTYFPFKEVLTEQEVELLKIAVDTLDDSITDGNLQLKKVIDKINFSIFNSDYNVGESEQIIPYSRVKNININEIKQELYIAILESLEVIINYRDNNGNVTERCVQPYQFFRYKGEYYLVAYCLLRNELRYFKLSRIKDYRVTSRNFIKTIDVNKVLEEHKHKSMGIFGGTQYSLVLEISPPIANTIKERIWVDNQEICDLDNGKILFKAVMKGGPEISSWILSMGDKVKIIEPHGLREEIRATLERALKNL